MRTTRLCAILLSGSISVGLLGCTHCHQRTTSPPCNTAVPAAPCNPGLVPSPVPIQGQFTVPAAPAPAAPPGAMIGPPPGASLQPNAPFPAGPGPEQRSNFGPPPDASWRPAPGSVQLASPEPMAGSQRSESPRLYPPTDATPPAGQAPRVLEQRTAPKPAASENRNPPSLPVGIPQFTIARDRVASGLRPMLDDGLDWLQSHGYRTVLHLRKPGEDDTADRKQVEKRGMRYLSLEVSPQTLSRQAVEEFNRTVSEQSNLPLFVYDRDGSLAGGLWYLHFRTAEQAADDAARVRAASLGLREDREGAHREMWLAIQRFLSEQGR